MGKAIALDIYKSILRPVLFSALKVDPEGSHQQVMRLLRGLQLQRTRPPVSWMLSRIEQACCVQDERLTQTLWGLKFPNPLGLAAGFDKNAEAAGIWGVLGFGYAELGTITRYPQPGNPRPRLFRLTADRAVLNRMGFNNQGCIAVSQHLQRLATQGLLDPRTPLGINLGKSKITPLTEAATDYVASFQQLRQWGDYFVVNVSSPNTPGLRSLQQAEQLSQILDALQQENQGEKPILVKIAPDLTWEAVAQVLDLAKTYQLAGLVATNTTIRRAGLKTERLDQTGCRVQEEAGGLSGLPLRDRATEIIRFIWQQTEGQLPIIGVGGIFTAEDAWEKITAGASLIQVYTGWIYEGPLMAQRVLKGLSQKLPAQGLKSIAEAVGRGHLRASSANPAKDSG